MGQSFDNRVFERQGLAIEELRRNLSDASARVYQLSNRVDLLEPAARFYLTIQQLVIDEPALMDEWQTFLALVALYRPELKGFSVD